MADTEKAGSQSEMQNDPAPQSEMDKTPASGEMSETTNPPTEQQEDPQKELKRLRDALAKVNDEASKHRHAAKELQELKNQIESEKLSEKERLEKQLSDLQAEHNKLTLQAQDRVTNAELRLQAQRLGIAHPDRAVRLIDRSALEYDDEGMPTNADKLLKDLLAEMPELKPEGKGPAPTGGGATNPPRSQTGGPQEITKEYVAQVQAGGPQAWNALSPELQQRISAFIRKGGLFKK